MSITATREVTLQTSDGQNIVVTEGDKVTTITTHVVECDGPRCASRNGIEKPRSFSFELEKVEKDQAAFPPEADGFLSLMLPARSPSNAGIAVPLCSVQCVKDYLTYIYIPPGPRQPLTPEQLAGLNSNVPGEPPTSLDGPSLAHTAGKGEFVRKTDSPEPTVIGQADGATE